ncbi:hypothetical protein DLJ53_20945 [Acuticoccus sediminis]|uniref:DUF1468 domain-containing protein n=1 Tax=Acuticoccus sediminis TaxID=2184697 RepID=A0A8B2NV52_9HYPH|nr:tripartite tricarboxylate transporter TctB family protein [Acuticoccus sediminis]RAI00180.1 hypothetical protein DLJ53_20945 [Acuticoccus sediminis]
MRRSTGDIAGGLVLAIGAVALLIYTAGADYQMGEGSAYDAALMPRIWLIVAAACAGTMVVRGAAETLLASVDTGRLADISPARFALAVGLTAAFIAAFVWLGYWPAMLLIVPLFSVVFGYRRPLAVAATTVGFAAITWVVFAEILNVRMMPWPGA